MRPEDAVDAALKLAERNDAGAVDQKKLIEAVAELIDFDADGERRQKAQRAVNRRRKPGSTAALGQLAIPGLGSYAYEPDRLVADNAGHLVEQDRALVDFKQAEADRARDNARRQQVTADRKTSESEGHAIWVIAQIQAGRPMKELTFGAYIRDTEVWSPEPAPIESDSPEEIDE